MEIRDGKMIKYGSFDVPRALDCPICKGKTEMRVFYQSVLVRVPIYCRHCKRSFETDYSEGIQISKI